MKWRFCGVQKQSSDYLSLRSELRNLDWLLRANITRYSTTCREFPKCLSRFDPIGIISAFANRLRSILQKVIKQIFPTAYRESTPRLCTSTNQTFSFTVLKDVCGNRNPKSSDMIEGVLLHLQTLARKNVWPKFGSIALFRFPCHSKIYPFLSTGKSMFAAFHKEWLKTLSQLILVCNFTCLITRALHREICEDLFVESLKLAVRSFVFRQEYPDFTVSDDGKHFVGANQVKTLNFQRNFNSENEYLGHQRFQKNSQWTLITPQATAL